MDFLGEGKKVFFKSDRMEYNLFVEGGGNVSTAKPSSGTSRLQSVVQQLPKSNRPAISESWERMFCGRVE